MVFQKLVSFQVEYAPQYQVTKYISQHSRLQAVHIYSKSSPLVKGYFAVGTECSNDSGVPHTLEHLVFMGSKKYPCKGLLDVAGGIAMSETNAWTATDQTVYTLSSAGWLGFRKLLPVYLDHLIYPTLTEHAYTTEVHHIDPEDLKDKGVVYSEMEGIESTSRFFTALEVQRKMFPEGSGYRSETGGLTKNLRNLTNEEIKQFHSEMYSADNLCVIVCGNVPEGEFLEILEQFDSELPAFNKERRKRPFVDTPASQIPAKLPNVVESTVEFPELDESQGEIVLCWIGKEYANTMDNLAVELLLKYLTETSLSPFSKQLIEIENPLATDADYDMDDFMRALFRLELHGVPTERLDEAKEQILELLSTHTIEIDRMRQVIDNSKWHNIYMLEKNESAILAEMTITDFLYGDEEGKTLKQYMDYLRDYDTLLTWDTNKWQDLLSEVFLENKPVIVIGKPSVEMYDKLEKEQKDLVEARRSSYSKEAIAQLQKKLADAQYDNNKPIPDEVLRTFVIEDPVNSVEFIETKSISTIEHEYNDLKDELTISTFKTRPKDFPLFIHLEHFPSQFVTVQLLLNSRVVKDTTLLPYCYLFRQLFKMPMKDEEERLIGYEEVVKQLENECMNHDIDFGFTNEFSDFISLEISCKSADYANAVKWIKHCLFDIVFDKARVHVLLEMFLNSIVERKRDGELMNQSLFNRHMFTDRSIKKSTDVLFVQNRLETVLEEISNGEFESKVLPKLESLRDQLRSHFHKFHILILGDMEKLGNIYKPWEPLVNKLPMDKSQVVVPPTPRSLETLSDLGKCPRKKAYIISTPASSSSYMSCASSVPINLDYHHRDFPAITLAAAYLQVVEGPFWKGIRGSGLAYGAYMVKRYEYNCLSFSVYRAVDAINCYLTAKYIIQGFAEGTTEFDEHHLHGAVSSVIHNIAIMASDYFGSAVMKYVDDFCKKRGPDFNTKFLARLSKVTTEDLKRVMQKYFVNMFDADKGVVFVSCNPSKLDPIQAFLEAQGYEVEVEELEDDHEDDCSSCCDSD